MQIYKLRRHRLGPFFHALVRRLVLVMVPLLLVPLLLDLPIDPVPVTVPVDPLGVHEAQLERVADPVGVHVLSGVPLGLVVGVVGLVAVVRRLLHVGVRQNGEFPSVVTLLVVSLLVVAFFVMVFVVVHVDFVVMGMGLFHVEEMVVLDVGVFVVVRQMVVGSFHQGGLDVRHKLSHLGVQVGFRWGQLGYISNCQRRKNWLRRGVVF